MNPQTNHSLVTLLKQITYKDWTFRVLPLGDGFFLQPVFIAPDNDVPGSPPAEVRGRKWYISAHSTDDEVVQTAFLAIKIAEEHEMRELFLFKGQRVFGPHFNLTKLAEFTKKTGEKHRA